MKRLLFQGDGTMVRKIWVKVTLGVMVGMAGRVWAVDYTTYMYPGNLQMGFTGVSNGVYVGNFSDSKGRHGFKYDGKTWTTLDDPSADSSTGWPTTTVSGIDGNNIVGNYNVGSHQRGFLYNGSTWTTIAGPIANYEVTVGGISGNKVVGYYELPSGGQAAFIWDGTSYQTFTDPASDYDTNFTAISGNTIVGDYTGSGGKIHGLIYDGTTWTTLDYPSPQVEGTIPMGISGNEIVGYCFPYAKASSWAFLYDGKNWTQLVAPGALTWSGTGSYAYGVEGNTVVGTFDGGYSPNPYEWDAPFQQGFVATVPAAMVPEAATVGMVVAAGCMMLVRRTRGAGVSR
jgi:hypothetical protein